MIWIDFLALMPYNNLQKELRWMVAIEGLYDNGKIELLSAAPMEKAEVMVIFPETAVREKKEKIDLSKYMGRGEKMFQTDAQSYVKELRDNDRI